MIMLNKDYKKEQSHQTSEKGFLESDKFFFLIVFSIFISPKLFLCGIVFIFLRFLYLCIALKHYQAKESMSYVKNNVLCDENMQIVKNDLKKIIDSHIKQHTKQCIKAILTIHKQPNKKDKK